MDDGEGPTMDLPDSDEFDDVVDVDEVNGEVLPISFRRRDIVDSVQRNRVTIIVAETGSGKSSQVVRSVGGEIVATVVGG